MQYLIDLGINLLASSIWFICGILLTLLGLRVSFIRRIYRKLGIPITLDRPQINFDFKHKPNSSEVEIIIKNVGNRVAYNVYAYLFELYGASPEESYEIKSLGNQKIRSGALAPNEQVAFADKRIVFNGCNVTSLQEIWVDYSDENSTSYRTVIHPPNARGEDIKIMPPFRIKHRLPLLPYLEHKGKKDWLSYRKGKSAL